MITYTTFLAASWWSVSMTLCKSVTNDWICRQRLLQRCVRCQEQMGPSRCALSCPSQNQMQKVSGANVLRVYSSVLRRQTASLSGCEEDLLWAYYCLLIVRPSSCPYIALDGRHCSGQEIDPELGAIICPPMKEQDLVSESSRVHNTSSRLDVLHCRK